MGSNPTLPAPRHISRVPGVSAGTLVCIPGVGWIMIASLSCWLLLALAPQDSLVTVRGRVVDAATNAPVAGAAVVRRGSRQGTLADQSGGFEQIGRAHV